MKTSFALVLALFCAFSFNEAKADLFYEGSCITNSSRSLIELSHTVGINKEITQQDILLVDLMNEKAAGLSCEQISAIKEATGLINVALMPVYAALSAPGVKGELIAQLAALGLTMSGPAIVGVTVLTSVGSLTIYLIMKKSMEDCNREATQKLKESIFRELEIKYRLQSNGNTSFQKLN